MEANEVSPYARVYGIDKTTESTIILSVVVLKLKLGTAGTTSTCIDAKVLPKEGSDWIEPQA